MNNDRMRQIFCLVVVTKILLISLCSCIRKTAERNTENLDAIKISISFPVLKNDGEFVQVKDSFHIIYLDDYVVYITPNDELSDKRIINSKGETIKYEIVSQKTVDQFFLFKKNQKFGYFFDSITSINPRTIEVNSFISEIMKMDYEKIYSKNDSLIEKKVFNNGYYEKYVKLGKNDRGDRDTSYLFFEDGFEGIEFSFYKEVDSLKGEKLTKIRYIQNVYPATTNTSEKKHREVTLSMEKVKIANRAAILNLIKRANK